MTSGRSPTVKTRAWKTEEDYLTLSYQTGNEPGVTIKTRRWPVCLNNADFEAQGHHGRFEWTQGFGCIPPGATRLVTHPISGIPAGETGDIYLYGKNRDGISCGTWLTEDVPFAQVFGKPKSDGQPGFPSGSVVMGCGCHGFAQIGSTASEPRCESGYVRVVPCGGFCPGGGTQYGARCE
jgi:hypothetical protein